VSADRYKDFMLFLDKITADSQSARIKVADIAKAYAVKQYVVRRWICLSNNTDWIFFDLGNGVFEVQRSKEDET